MNDHVIKSAVIDLVNDPESDLYTLWYNGDNTINFNAPVAKEVSKALSEDLEISGLFEFEAVDSHTLIYSEVN